MLVDAGPLVALCDRNQPEHPRCKIVLLNAPIPLVSTWACFVEAMHLLGRIGGYPLQEHLWHLVSETLIALHEHDQNEIDRMPMLMKRYQNVPMDLADASLIERTIFTLDSDFRIYRLADGSALEVVPT